MHLTIKCEGERAGRLEIILRLPQALDPPEAARTFRLSPNEMKRIVHERIQERLRTLRGQSPHASRGERGDRPHLHGGVPDEYDRGATML